LKNKIVLVFWDTVHSHDVLKLKASGVLTWWCRDNLVVVVVRSASVQFNGSRSQYHISLSTALAL